VGWEPESRDYLVNLLRKLVSSWAPSLPVRSPKS
jgi:hypothetical protein